MLNPTFNSAGEFYNKLNLFFHLLIAGPLLVFVFLYLESNAGDGRELLVQGEMATVLRYSLPMIIILSAAMSFVMFKRSLQVARNEVGLQNKLSHYFRYSFVKYGMIEFSSIAAVLGLYLTDELIYTVLYVALLMLLSVSRPTVYRICRELKLDGKEKDIVLHKKEMPPVEGI